MKVSMMTYTMARGDWGKAPDVEELCKLCKELDIEAIDWITDYGISAADIRRITDDYGLKNICYTFFNVDMQSPDAATRANGLVAAKIEMEKAVTLGSDKVMVVMPGVPDVPKEETRVRTYEGLNKLVEIGKTLGLTVTSEHFPGKWSLFGTSEDMNIAVREVPGFAVTYDNGNVIFQGEDSVDAYLNSWEHVAHVHFKDWSPADSGIQAVDGTFYQGALIGEGIIDTRGCLAAMHKHGYNGYINLEYEGNDYTPEEAMRKGTPVLQRMIAEL